MSSRDDSVTASEEYRCLVEGAEPSPEALPGEAFFDESAEREVDAGRAAAVRKPLDINDLQDARAAQEASSRAPLPIGVLLSGSGTNLQALIDAIAAGTLNAQIKLVVASRPSAYGLKRAEAAGIRRSRSRKTSTRIPSRPTRSSRMNCWPPDASTWSWPATCAWFTPRCWQRFPIA